MHPAIANLTFGVEFEVVVPPQFNRTAAALEVGRRAGLTIDSNVGPSGRNWKVVGDGSVRGPGTPLEFVSRHVPPLQGEAGLQEASNVANALREMGAIVNPSCGFHVHVGVPSGAGIDFFKNLVKLYGRYEEVIDSIMPPSRRGNGHNAYYCKSVKLIRPEVIDRAQGVTELALAIQRASGADRERYHKVNLMAFRKHHTVEFRQHSGTVDATKTINWVVTCLKLVAAALAGKTGADTAQRIAWDLSRLVGKQAHVAKLIARPEGATNEEIKAAHHGVIKGARSHLKKTGLPYRVERDRVTGKERFFAAGLETTVVAPHPVTLQGLADLIDADADLRAYLEARQQATNDPTR
jgi:Putative amidoligase enzyme